MIKNEGSSLIQVVEDQKEDESSLAENNPADGAPQSVNHSSIFEMVKEEEEAKKKKDPLN